MPGERAMDQPVTIYGIKACDTMKKARAWLDAHGIAYRFHDYKVLGLERPALEAWVGAVGWEVLLNRAGTTFRALPDARKTGLDAEQAIGLMLAQKAMIKRPVLAVGDRLIVGFKPEIYEAALL
jgi:arsenate reductase